jgi:hypothetical protein
MPSGKGVIDDHPVPELYGCKHGCVGCKKSEPEKRKFSRINNGSGRSIDHLMLSRQDGFGIVGPATGNRKMSNFHPPGLSGAIYGLPEQMPGFSEGPISPVTIVAETD